MNNYDKLLVALQETRGNSLTINCTVTEQNLRRGLKRAVETHNALQVVLELEEETRNISISTNKSTDTFTITLADKTAGQFEFQLVQEDLQDGPEEIPKSVGADESE